MDEELKPDLVEGILVSIGSMRFIGLCRGEVKPGEESWAEKKDGKRRLLAVLDSLFALCRACPAASSPPPV